MYMQKDLIHKNQVFFKSWQRHTLPGPNAQVPSALRDLTSVFGMGTGVTPSLQSPGISNVIRCVILRSIVVCGAHVPSVHSAPQTPMCLVLLASDVFVPWQSLHIYFSRYILFSESFIEESNIRSISQHQAQYKISSHVLVDNVVKPSAYQYRSAQCITALTHPAYLPDNLSGALLG